MIQNTVICAGCHTLIADKDIGAGLNMPDVTDGPQYWCQECSPSLSADEIIAEFESFIDPPRESSVNSDEQ